MKKNVLLLPRMAATNIRRNGSIYFPYMGASIFAMFTYFVFDLILKNDIMYSLPKGAYAVMLVSIGFGLLGIIMVPFLYYTNSFLIKRRKRELGLYSILGLEKKHIGVMMLWESAAMYLAVTASAIVLGLLFARLIFLLLLNLAKMPVNVEFTVSPAAVTDTLVFYAFVTGLNLMVNLVQVGRANPVELMSDSRKGEKEPRRIGLWSLVGLASLCLGYRMALMAQLDSSIFTDFFLAVFLVVIGTYCLFTSGSIAVLRLCKKRKKYYYRAENFVTVSGMLYRMKKNAASLSNICIFSTMAIITVVCTVTVYLGMESIVTSDFSRQFEIFFYGKDRAEGEAVMEDVAKLAKRRQVSLEDELQYSYVKIRAYHRKDHMYVQGEPYDFSGWVNLIMMTKEEYMALEGREIEVLPGEVLVFSSGVDYQEKEIWFEELCYSVREELMESRIDKKEPDNRMHSQYLVVFSDREQLNRASMIFGVDGFEGVSWMYGFKPVGGDINGFSQELANKMSARPGFAQYEDHREHMEELESMYGGLLFIGVFFGSIFLICLIIIMYYKQITEGFEDQKNFEVMQKVGLSDGEIRRTIKKQVSLVFGMPLAGALLHTVVGMRMVYMLMGAIDFFEPQLLAACTAVCCLIFAVLYAASYRRTSMAYYRIVK